MRTMKILLQMKYVDDMDDKAIARTLNIGQDSVRAYLSRARRQLLKIIKEVDENG